MEGCRNGRSSKWKVVVMGGRRNDESSSALRKYLIIF